jgi:ABC-type antimicrobial peptide transport system permease subunit
LIGDIRRVVLESVSNIRMVEVKPFSSLLEGEFRSWRLGSALLTAFGALALIVSIAGITSSLLFEVAQRRFELAVRSALGASSAALVRTSTVRSLAVCGIGTVFGLVLGLIASSRAGALLFRVSPVEPAVVLGVVGTILAASVVATAIPAWRAVRADPRTALQSE